jgi:hypothetical protein
MSTTPAGSQRRSASPSKDAVPARAPPVGDEFASLQGAAGQAGARNGRKQATLASRAPKSSITAAGAMFSAYKPSGVRVSYAENKIGIMPNLEDTLSEIASTAGLDTSDPDIMSQFLEAMVTDVYVNPYSDKQTFDGDITVGSFSMPRRIIAEVIQPKVGTMHRRFARAMAPLIVQVMHDNYTTFGDVLDKRCAELNLSTRAEAVRHFDGSDALTVIDRDSARRAAEVKHLALSLRPTSRAYTTAGSAASTGLHDE